MEKLDLTIGIVNYNTSDLLKSCILSIIEKTKGVSYRVVVVDNASKDNSVAMLKAEFPKVEVIENKKNVGFPSAVNQAIAISDSRYFLLFNSDAQPLNDAFSAIIDFMDSHPKVGICTPQLYYPNGELQVSHYPFRYPNERSKWEISPRMKTLKSLIVKEKEEHTKKGENITKEAANSPQPVQRPRGVCFMIKKECIEDIGPMDGNFFIYSDEVDFAWRARNAGWKRYIVPAAKVKHEQGGSTRKMASLMDMIHVQSDYYYFYKHFGIIGWSKVRLSYLAGALLALLLGVLSKSAKSLSEDQQPQKHFADFKALMTLFLLVKKIMPPDAR